MVRGMGGVHIANLAVETAPPRLKPIVHLRGRAVFVRVGGQCG